MSDFLAIQCPECDARIRAPKALVGQTRKCPRCETELKVKRPPPSDEEPAIVYDTSAFEVDLDSRQ